MRKDQEGDKCQDPENHKQFNQGERLGSGAEPPLGLSLHAIRRCGVSGDNG
jgi:hypothetical protein